MKTIIPYLILLILVTFNYNSISAPVINEVNVLNSNYSTSKYLDNEIFVFDQNGIMIYSSNNGKNWEMNSFFSDLNHYNETFINKDKWYFCLTDKIVKTNNRGINWDTISFKNKYITPVGLYYYSVSVFLVAGNDNSIYKTINGGSAFYSVHTDSINWNINLFFTLPKDTLLILGNKTNLFSIDSGSTWNEYNNLDYLQKGTFKYLVTNYIYWQDSTKNLILFSINSKVKTIAKLNDSIYSKFGDIVSITINEQGNGILIDFNGFIYITSDFGYNWRIISYWRPNLSGCYNDNDITIDNNGRFYILTKYSNLYRSDDNACTWQPVNLKTNKLPYASNHPNTNKIYCCENSNVVVLNENGLIFSKDSGYTMLLSKYDTALFNSTIEGWITHSFQNVDTILVSKYTIDSSKSNKIKFKQIVFFSYNGGESYDTTSFNSNFILRNLGFRNNKYYGELIQILNSDLDTSNFEIVSFSDINKRDTILHINNNKSLDYCYSDFYNNQFRIIYDNGDSLEYKSSSLFKSSTNFNKDLTYYNNPFKYESDLNLIYTSGYGLNSNKISNIYTSTNGYDWNQIPLTFQTNSQWNYIFQGGGLFYKNKTLYICGKYRAGIDVPVLFKIKVDLNQGGTGVEDKFTYDSNSNLEIFPNPCIDDKLYFRLRDGKSSEMNYQVVNLLGIVMAEHTLNNNSNFIDISNIGAGVYFLNIRSGNKSYHSKFVKI